MPLQPFSFPFPQTRFFMAGAYLYKFVIRGGSTFSEVDAAGKHWHNLKQELEDIIRTVLGNLESLQPFSSAHFHVHPYKKVWESMSQVMCKHSEKDLKAYPFTLIIYLEKNACRDTPTEEAVAEGCTKRVVQEEEQCVSELPVKRRRTDSPLEDAILKDLVKDMEADSEVTVRRLGTERLPLLDSEDDSQPEDKVEFVDAVIEKQNGEDEENEEDEEDEDQDAPVEETPVQPQMLSKLAKRLFPFSLFFRDT